MATLPEETIPTPDSPTPARWSDVLLLVLLAPVVVWGCFSSPPLGYDDPAHLSHELLSKAGHWYDFFRPTENSTYFPLTILSYRIDAWLHQWWLTPLWPKAGLAPSVRLDSLLLHAASGIFIWRTFLNLKVGRWLSLFAAAAWVAHPAACESVAWASERKNVMAGLFGFAAVWAFCGGVRRQPLRELITLLLYLAALLSKPTAAGFITIFIAYELIFRGRKFLPVAASFAAMLAATAWLAKVNVAHNQQTMVQPLGGSLFTAVLSDAPIVWRYLYNAVCPVSLSIFYQAQPVVSIMDPRFFLGALALAGVAGGTIWICPQRRLVIFLWLWFFGALGPALNIIPLPFPMQDRYAYFSLPALMLIIALTAVSLVEKIKLNLSNGFWAAAGTAVLLCLTLSAAARSTVFSNDLLLFRDATAKQPSSVYAHTFLGLILSETADVLEMSGRNEDGSLRMLREEAYSNISAAMKSPEFERMIDPGRVHVVEGVLLERLGRGSEALAVLREALAAPQKPYNYLAGAMAMARLEVKDGHPAEALRWLNLGLGVMGGVNGSPEALLMAGECYEQMGQLEMAMNVYSAIPSTSSAASRAAERLRRMRNKAEKY